MPRYFRNKHSHGIIHFADSEKAGIHISMQNIIVDIDNTLWDFASVFHDRLKERVPDIPPVTEWEWDFHRKYIAEEDLYRIFDGIHREQHLFEPFPSAQFFLESLSDRGYEIIIASHRDENSREATESFLKKNNLQYTELHLIRNKTVLFDSCSALIDDAPYLLEEAKRHNLVRAGLLHPWNRHSGHPLFDSLEQVLEFLLTELQTV